MNRDAKFILRVASVIFFLALIGGYSYYQARKLIDGPEIVIDSPKDGETVTDPLIDIKGKATNIKDISLDDRPVFIDEQGNFDEKLLVQEGYTIITMKASDRFGETTQKSISLYYNPPLTTSTST